MVRTIAEEDMERGRLECAQFLLRRMLEKHFGTLPETLLDQITASNDLDRLNETILRASELKSLAEVQL
jgi:hypothetical protein